MTGDIRAAIEALRQLRQEVRAAIERGESDVCGCDDHRGPAHDIATDNVMSVFAGWLQDRAAEQRRLGDLANVVTDRARCDEKARWYEALADEISPERDKGRE